jgi:hypothetical protein
VVRRRFDDGYHVIVTENVIKKRGESAVERIGAYYDEKQI